jgi:hypothetical protein
MDAVVVFAVGRFMLRTAPMSGRGWVGMQKRKSDSPRNLAGYDQPGDQQFAITISGILNPSVLLLVLAFTSRIQRPELVLRTSKQV